MTDAIRPTFGAVSPDSPAVRYTPEPDGFGAKLGQIVGGVGSAAAAVAGGALGGLDPTNQLLIAEQMRAQKEMMMVSLISNISKSEHETEMAAVRNVRVG